MVRTQTVIEISSDDDDEQGGPARYACAWSPK